jgi:hypothetical protein
MQWSERIMQATSHHIGNAEEFYEAHPQCGQSDLIISRKKSRRGDERERCSAAMAANTRAYFYYAHAGALR